jgi:hypothetical protein
LSPGAVQILAKCFGFCQQVNLGLDFGSWLGDGEIKNVEHFKRGFSVVDMGFYVRIAAPNHTWSQNSEVFEVGVGD